MVAVASLDGDVEFDGLGHHAAEQALVLHFRSVAAGAGEGVMPRLMVGSRDNQAARSPGVGVFIAVSSGLRGGGLGRGPVLHNGDLPRLTIRQLREGDSLLAVLADREVCTGELHRLRFELDA